MIMYVYPVMVVKFVVPDEELDLEGLSRQEADSKRLDWIEEHTSWYDVVSSIRRLPPGAEYAEFAEKYEFVAAAEKPGDLDDGLVWYNQGMEPL